MMNSKDDSSKLEEEEDPLPGFRFHPTDEELVGFYLRRKVDRKPIRIELIKQIDIYKYDPWDLPKGSGAVGENESYFFCKRGRKYRNSIRPNRVTGSGFWKATGIDKPVYSHEGEDRHDHCIGLKKTLVYYRGSAGKGTKTDWMMHEFRLPTNVDASTRTSLQEAEVWTLCRIFKRNASSRKYTPDWRELAMKRAHHHHPVDHTDHAIFSKQPHTSGQCNNNGEAYINFGAPITHHQYHQYINHDDQKPVITHMIINHSNPLHAHQLITSLPLSSPSAIPSCSSISNLDNSSSDDQLLSCGNWDELRPVVEFALDHHPSLL